MFPPVSIIIAVKANNRFLEECVSRCLEIDYPFFEIIIMPDDMIGTYSDPRIKIVPTGATLPAAKRDIGCENANGQIIAFLDDDTYPTKDWLKQAVLNFNEEAVACVCGPAVTPNDDSFLSKASGKIYESIAISGPARFRYVPMKKRTTDDFPSCNFLIRKNIFQQIGGFQTKFWPGEDTILCSQVVHELYRKIVYDPLVKVFHHRRPLYKSHLKQIISYALHRGYFVKRFPKTSRRLGYFLPSLIVASNIFSIIGGFFLDSRWFVVLGSYLGMMLFFSLSPNAKMTYYVFTGSISSHFLYGIYFLKGLFSRKLKEE
ncbi:glycosyltransferase [Thermoproteota archaeon]